MCACCSMNKLYKKNRYKNGISLTCLFWWTKPCGPYLSMPRRDNKQRFKKGKEHVLFVRRAETKRDKK